MVSIDGVANDGQAGEADNVEPGVERMIGGDGADTLIGTPGNDSIDGAGGDDLIDGIGGDDSLEGGTVDGGSDTEGRRRQRHAFRQCGRRLSGRPGGADAANGGEGADFVEGGPGADRLTGAAGCGHPQRRSGQRRSRGR